MSPKSGSILMTHDEPTEKVYALIHGWTNSPFQWVDFGEMLYERGHNVLILRMLYHGLPSPCVFSLCGMILATIYLASIAGIKVTF